jgi:hypothetical protein
MVHLIQRTFAPFGVKSVTRLILDWHASKQSGAKKYYNKIFEGYFLHKQKLEL